MDPSENPDDGQSLWTSVQADVKPFGISKDPKTHVLSADLGQAMKTLPGEQNDPRLC